MKREEAISELSVIWERLSHPEDCENGCYSFRDGNYLEAIDMAIEALSADAVQGEWRRVETRTYKGECTNCGFRHIFMDGHDSQYRFCPNCGARMYKGGGKG